PAAPVSGRAASRARSPRRPGRHRFDPGPVLLLGGASDIGMEVALRIAAATADEGRTVILAARRTTDPERRSRLEANAEALRAAGAARTAVCEFDADDLASHRGFVDG